MTLKEAIIKRIETICFNQNVTYEELADMSKTPPAMLYNLMDESRPDTSLLNLKKLCDGLSISLSEFFADELFDNID